MNFVFNRGGVIGAILGAIAGILVGVFLDVQWGHSSSFSESWPLESLATSFGPGP